MKLSKLEKIAGVILLILLITSIVSYIINFGFSISSNSSDWGNFGSYLSGTMITILTIINIWLFFRLTLVVESKNNERAVRNKIYETQAIISQMRMKLYENIRPVINGVKAELFATDTCQSSKRIELEKLLLETDSSLLFCTGNNTNSFLHAQTEEVLNLMKRYDNPRMIHVDSAPLIKALNSYLYQMEYYIIMQSIKDNEVYKYITEHSDDMDSTIKCLNEISHKAFRVIQLDNVNKES